MNSISNGNSSDIDFNNMSKEERLGEEAAQRYVKNCRMLDLNIDPGVVISLRTRWKIMQPTKKLGEGGLLPLMGILDNSDHIKKLNLNRTCMSDRYKSAGNGNSNARVLNLMLRKNTAITDLDLSNTGIDDDGLEEICESLKHNKSITNLDLARNHFTSLGADHLRKALAENKGIKKLDITFNSLGYHTINQLQCACIPNGIDMNIRGNFVFEEVLNSVSHGVGFLLSVVGAILLMTESMANHSTDYHFWACFLFSFSLMFLFLASTLFHSFFMFPHASFVLLILDHVGIYLLIAGSYTPFLLITLHESLTARIMTVIMWLVAITGCVFTACSDQESEETHRIELIMYVIMGFACLPIWTLFSTALVPASLTLIILMGAAYTFGIYFFIKGKDTPIYHCVWHVFVMVGAALTWFNVYFYVVNTKFDFLQM